LVTSYKFWPGNSGPQGKDKEEVNKKGMYIQEKKSMLQEAKAASDNNNIIYTMPKSTTFLCHTEYRYMYRYT